jgi:hypothetical protein
LTKILRRISDWQDSRWAWYNEDARAEHLLAIPSSPSFLGGSGSWLGKGSALLVWTVIKPHPHLRAHLLSLCHVLRFIARRTRVPAVSAFGLSVHDEVRVFQGEQHDVDGPQITRVVVVDGKVSRSVNAPIAPHMRSAWENAVAQTAVVML